ncbi:hypothetical protein OSTOST_21170, partial [Ostertagia ostertagi]
VNIEAESLQCLELDKLEEVITKVVGPNRTWLNDLAAWALRITEYPQVQLPKSCKWTSALRTFGFEGRMKEKVRKTVKSSRDF